MKGNQMASCDGVKSTHIPPEYFLKYSGLEILEMIVRGELPGPAIARLLNFELIHVEAGRAKFQGEPGLEHYNPVGTVHVGWPATILDSAMGCAVQTRLPAGMIFTTAEFKVNLVRPLFHDSGRVHCESDVIHFGRTIATSQANLKLANGKLVAHGTCTCAIMSAAVLKDK